MNDTSSTNIGIAVIVLGILTCALIIQQQVGFENSFMDGVSALRPAIGAIFITAAAFWWQNQTGGHTPLFRVELIWPIGMLMVWTSFFAVVKAWGTDIPGSMTPVFDAFPEADLDERISWYASEWIYYLVSAVILSVGYWFSLIRGRIH